MTVENPWPTRRELFLAIHPELRKYLVVFLSAYRTCQWEQLDGGTVDLDEAYRHIFEEKCARCNGSFESGMKLYASWLAPGAKRSYCNC